MVYTSAIRLLSLLLLSSLRSDAFFVQNTSPWDSSPTTRRTDRGLQRCAPLQLWAAQKLSRPERKALERQKKLQSNMKVRKLMKEASAADILKRFKQRIPMDDLLHLERLANQVANNKNNTTANETKVVWNQLAIAALHQGRHDMVERCLRKSARIKGQQLHVKPVSLAVDSSHKAPLPQNNGDEKSVHVLIRTLLHHANYTETAWDLYETELHGQNARVLCSMATIFFRHQNVLEGLRACRMLRQTPQSSADEDPRQWTQLIQAAAQCQASLRNGTLAVAESIQLPSNLVYAVLQARRTPSTQQIDPAYFESIQNALSRRIVFCTGAVTMQGCPPPDRPEICCIGRSNVGKSSLINLLTNRKSVAFTSKRPGKTQQFNYFAVNDKPGLAKFIRYGDPMDARRPRDADAFYLVDLPGFGYAQVPTRVRERWTDFWSEYLTTRGPSLRLILHLMDGRHGPTAEDVATCERILHVQQEQQQQSSSKGSSFTYVVVLTKADKNGKLGEVSRAVQDAVSQLPLPSGTPVLTTSAERRWGLDALWRCIANAVDQGY